MSVPWIDLHCHLDKLTEGVEEALELASESGVHRVITIGTEPSDHPVVVALGEKYFPRVACTLGVHPHEARLFDDAVEDFIVEKAPKPFVVAVAEIGLDYYYDHSPRDVQREIFRRQMTLAENLELPVQIHTRDAESDTKEVLKEFSGRVRGVIHCFTGSADLAKAALDSGFNISISGVVTFKNADDLRKTVQMVPLDRLHVETDAPFLAPVPMRGKSNTPAHVVHTAKKVAELKGIDLEEFRQMMLENARKTFPKLSL